MSEKMSVHEGDLGIDWTLLEFGHDFDYSKNVLSFRNHLAVTIRRQEACLYYPKEKGSVATRFLWLPAKQTALLHLDQFLRKEWRKHLISQYRIAFTRCHFTQGHIGEATHFQAHESYFEKCDLSDFKILARDCRFIDCKMPKGFMANCNVIEGEWSEQWRTDSPGDQFVYTLSTKTLSKNGTEIEGQEKDGAVYFDQEAVTDG